MTTLNTMTPTEYAANRELGRQAMINAGTAAEVIQQQLGMADTLYVQQQHPQVWDDVRWLGINRSEITRVITGRRELTAIDREDIDIYNERRATVLQSWVACGCGEDTFSPDHL